MTEHNADYREQGYKPRKSDELWERSPMNPEKKKEEEDKKKMENYMAIPEDCVR
jgi:hypothetical protein